jgi:CRISPR-associated protein Cas1
MRSFQRTRGYGLARIFQPVGVLLSEVTELTGRQKRPAYEPFNALLNYLYGMLYTSVLLGLLKSGIDPYIGVLHADQYGGAPTLSYDFIEPYRPWADEVALELMLSREIRDDGDDFEKDSTGHGYRLSRQGRGKAIEAMLAYMDDEVGLHQGRMLKRSTQVDVAAQALAALLKRD